MRALKSLAIFAAVAVSSAAHAQTVDWKKIDEVLGRTAAVTQDVHRYGFPRSDLQVTLDGRVLFTTFDRGRRKDGRIGLWTREDNVTRFDQIEIRALPNTRWQ